MPLLRTPAKVQWGRAMVPCEVALMAEPANSDSAKSRLFDDDSTELSSRRTGMSFQRTRLSAERTLMSVVRTSLSMISFGFTIYSFFGHLQEQKVLLRTHAPRNFGMTLIVLGVAILMMGIGYHGAFMRELRNERAEMAEEGLIRARTHFPVSYTLIVAVLLLLLGLTAIADGVFHFGPFG
jgi:putative membrane protein